MGSAAHARAREAITRICRGEADARTLRLEALDALRSGYTQCSCVRNRLTDGGGRIRQDHPVVNGASV